MIMLCSRLGLPPNTKFCLCATISGKAHVRDIQPPPTQAPAVLVPTLRNFNCPMNENHDPGRNGAGATHEVSTHRVALPW